MSDRHRTGRLYRAVMVGILSVTLSLLISCKKEPPPPQTVSNVQGEVDFRRFFETLRPAFTALLAKHGIIPDKPDPQDKTAGITFDVLPDDPQLIAAGMAQADVFITGTNARDPLGPDMPVVFSMWFVRLRAGEQWQLVTDGGYVASMTSDDDTDRDQGLSPELHADLKRLFTPTIDQMDYLERFAAIEEAIRGKANGKR